MFENFNFVAYAPNHYHPQEGKIEGTRSMPYTQSNKTTFY
jgi:hypothetical protein